MSIVRRFLKALLQDDPVGFVVKDKRDNANKSAKAIALVAIPPFHCAIAAKFHPVLAVSVLLVEKTMALWIAAIVMK